MFDLDLTFQTVIILALVLAFLFIYLLVYTYWTRKRNEYWRGYEKKFRNYFFPQLLDYAEQTESAYDADEIVDKIGSRTKDYVFFMQLVDELLDILDGKEKKRLNSLLGHSVFLNFYKNKLSGVSKDSQVYACLYFQHTGIINDRTLAKLIMVSKSSNLKLAFAATKALQSTGDFAVSKSALYRFFKRDNISELMVVELLHRFDSKGAENREKVLKTLNELLAKDVEMIAKSMVVRYMGDQKFYNNSDFLFQFLKRLQYSQNKRDLIKSLLIVMGEFREKQSTPLLRQYSQQKEVDISVRLAAIRALSEIGKEQDLIFLTKSLLNVPFALRKGIIYELAFRGEHRIELLEEFLVANLAFIKQLQARKQLPGQIREVVVKIKNIAEGIDIVLIQRLNKTNV